MRIICKKGVWIVIALIMIAALSGCGISTGNSNQSAALPDPKQETYYIFDTIVTVKIYDDRADATHFQQIGLLLEEIDTKMSRTLPGSEIAKVNEQAGKHPVPVSEETLYVLQKALDYAELSGGRFDPTIGPLVSLWQIGNEGQRIPTETEIADIINLINYQCVEIDRAERTIKLTQPGMAIDLGAIAKGYAADRIAEYIVEAGFDSALIDLGGNIYAVGSKPGDAPWTIGIQDPEDDRGKPIGKVKVRNKTIVSSGVYERYFIEDEVRYHHILDPKLGYPVKNELVSVTIVTDHSLDADALSTSAFAMGLDDGLALIEALGNTEAIFITEEHHVYVTSGLKDNLEMLVDKYKLID